MTIRVKPPFGYFPDPTKFGCVALGVLYIGEPDQNPITDPITVTSIEEDGTETIGISQPISLNAGGQPTKDGSVVILKVDQAYSMRILDEVGGSQIYSFERIDRENVAYSFDDVAELRASTIVPDDGEVISLNGYWALGDGGGQALIWDADSSAADDGVTTFKADAATGRYVARKKEAINIRLAGAKVDNTADDTAAIIRAEAVGTTIIFPEGTCLISTSHTTTVPWQFDGGAMINIDSGDTLTIDSEIIAVPTQQIFSGSGTVAGDTTNRFTGIESIYVCWFGVDVSDSSDPSTKIQSAIDLAQDLDCYVEFPEGGYLVLDTALTMKQGRDVTTRVRYSVKIRGNHCILANKATLNDVAISVIPKCLYSDASTGDAHGHIEIRDLYFDGNLLAGGSTNGKAMSWGVKDYYIEPQNMGELENLWASGYNSVPFFFTATTHLVINRMRTTTAGSGGVQFFQESEGIVGGITFNNCKFVGTATNPPVKLNATSDDGSTAKVRGVRFIDCVFFGSGSIVQVGLDGQAADIWFDRCAWDGPNFTDTEVVLLLNATSDGVLDKININAAYIVGNLAMNNTFIRLLSDSSVDTSQILITNGMFAQCLGLKGAIWLDGVKDVTIHGNTFHANDLGVGVGEVYIEATGANLAEYISIQDNRSTTPTADLTQFVYLTAGDGDNFIITGNTAKAIPVTGGGAYSNELIADNFQFDLI